MCSKCTLQENSKNKILDKMNDFVKMWEQRDVSGITGLVAEEYNQPAKENEIEPSSSTFQFVLLQVHKFLLERLTLEGSMLHWVGYPTTMMSASSHLQPVLPVFFPARWSATSGSPCSPLK